MQKEESNLVLNVRNWIMYLDVRLLLEYKSLEIRKGRYPTRWISALFYSIFMDAICSLLHPNFSPYLIQYFVEAFTKDCLDNGSVTDKCPIFLFAINLASFFIFPFTKKDNGVVKNASPAPIANVEQNSYLFCLQKISLCLILRHT